MSTTEHQSRIDNLSAQLKEIDNERGEIRDTIDHAKQQLAQARADLAYTHRAIAEGKPVEADDLLAETRAVHEIEVTLADLEQQAGPNLASLDERAEQLRSELGKADDELKRSQLSEAVLAYQQALHDALPLADAVRRAASAAGVMLPWRDKPSILIDRGTHVAGGVVIELRD